MTEMNEDEKKRRNRFPDRFTIEPENLEKVGRLLDQLRSRIKGCDATRKEILNWIIGRFPGELSADDLKELTARFYDEERFLKLALEEVRNAKSRGERRTLEEIMQQRPQTTVSATRRPRKKKTTESANDSAPEMAETDPAEIA